MKPSAWVLLVFAVGAAAVGSVAAYRVRAAAEATPPTATRPAVVRCLTLRVRPYAVTETFYGLVEAQARVDMAFQVTGRVSQIGASRDQTLRENDRVERGQVLALLDPLRHQAEAQRAEAETEAARSRMTTAETRVTAAQARLELAQRELTRLEGLRSQGAGNPREVDNARTAAKAAQAEVDGATADLAAATAGYNSARAAQTVADVGLQDAVLRAPMPGIVAKVPVEVGQIVNPAQPVVTLVDVSRVKLVLRVVEAKLPLLKRGQRVRIDFQALNAVKAATRRGETGSRTGTITLVPPAADAVTGLFHVEIELDNRDGLLRPGMIGKAAVAVADRLAIAIPADAVTRAGDRCSAYFVAPSYRVGLDLGGLGQASIEVPASAARRIEFEPAALDKDFYLVNDLPAGLNRVVVEGQSRLTREQPVVVVEEGEEG